MSTPPPAVPPGPLAGIRVVDLAGERAALCGRILADLGAEVTVVEPRDGSALRRMPPFDRRTGESLYWAAVASGKRSRAIDLEDPTARPELLALIAEADVLVESHDPGELDRLGLGPETLRARFPRLVHVSVTPWGQDGPRALQPASDLTVEAAAGLLGLQGDGDRPPVPVGYPQAGFHAGVQAAADAVIALLERDRSGLGQHLDVSMQACMVWTLMHATGFPPNTGGDPPGTGEQRAQPAAPTFPGLERPPRLLECADGWVTISYLTGAPGFRTLEGMLRWAAEEGAAPAELAAERFSEWTLRGVGEGAHDVTRLNDAMRVASAFAATRTKADLFRRAVDHSLLIAPIYSVADLAADPQLADRGYWTTLDGRRHPGAFARLSRTPVARRGGPPAPNDALFVPPGTPSPAAPALDAARPGEGGAPPHATRPFAGLRVADFSWVGVAPMIGKALADHGATVVRVESSLRPDVLRTIAPFKDNVAGLDRAQFMANFNTSKLGLALNLATPAGRDVARRLAGWADVVLESFTPGTMARLGLDWETLSDGRPDLVMLSSCLRGQTGPEAAYGGFGGQGAALAGIHAVTGWPDRPPHGPWGAYTDFIAPRFGVAALAAALFERRRSGRGQHIDLAQVEAGIHFIEPLVLDYTVNGRVAPPAGHDSPTDCPHGVYPAAGSERYVAIAVRTAGQWRGLRAVAPLDAFADPRFEALAERQAERARIDEALGAWTASQDPFLLEARLARAGVPASVVQRPSDLYRDAQLAHRGFFTWLDHAVMGPTPYDGPATRFSRTPAVLARAAPALGEHSTEVLTRLLGMSGAEVATLAADGVLT